MPSKISMSSKAIAVNRFGLGARVNDTVPSNPKAWLHSQLNNYVAVPAEWKKQANTNALMKRFSAFKSKKPDIKKEKMLVRRSFNRGARVNYGVAVNMRMQSALATETPFIERLVHFWANHFAISTEKPDVTHFAPALELDAIRPFVLGNFSDMLMAVEKHPAMLLYLSQVSSIGPNSKAGIRANKRRPQKNRGLNENLAREIMELHTLGVRSGYSQNDVTEFARALTGWSVQGLARDKNRTITGNGFVFRPYIHEPGDRNIIGRNYAQTGVDQAEAVLMDLAHSPATARHIATKLVRHFVSDDPPASLIKKLADAYMRDKGNLSSMYRALIDAKESWQTAPAKFKTPWEWMVSILRGVNLANLDTKNLKQKDLKKIKIAQIMKQLNQPIWKPGSPAGYDDISDSWLAPSALLRRVELAQRIASIIGNKFDGRILGKQILLDAISEETQTAITRSESAVSGLALLFVSPEFLRR